MTWQSVLGYVLTSLVGPLAGWLCAHYGQTELGGVLAVGIAGLGSRLLHMADPPAGKGATPTQLLPLLLLLPFLGSGCAWLQRPATQKIIKCTGDVAGQCADGALEAVTTCLSAPANPTPCLLALVGEAGCATKEALVCATKQAAAPSLVMTLVENTGPEQHRREQAERFYADMGMRPAP